jgi:addiction module HigA family antidote
VSPRRINEIVHGKRAITADTALRLSRAVGLSDMFFVNMRLTTTLKSPAGTWRPHWPPSSA